MTCAETKAMLPELAGGELTGVPADDARAHAAACDACGALLAELEASVALCRRSGDEPLPDDFTAGLHAKLVAAGPPPVRLLDRVRRALAARPIAALTASATLAGCIAVLGTLAVAHRATPAGTRAAIADVHRVPRSKIALVRVDFVADEAVEDVAFEVLLPDGLHFYSEGHALAERSFSWRGRLAPGSNPIPIAVKGDQPGRYHVIAHATGTDLDVVQDVVIEVTS